MVGFDITTAGVRELSSAGTPTEERQNPAVPPHRPPPPLEQRETGAPEHLFTKTDSQGIHCY